MAPWMTPLLSGWYDKSLQAEPPEWQVDYPSSDERVFLPIDWEPERQFAISSTSMPPSMGGYWVTGTKL